MNHPKIIAGRHGLPATSNIPWSVADELELRRQVLFYFICAWGSFLGALVLFMRRDWLAGVVVLVCFCVTAFAVSDLRKMLHAMLLNKPRTTEGLTQWIEHVLPFTQDPGAYQFLCRCSRMVDMLTAPYFKDTRRYSIVCECGIGHFMVIPKAAGPKLVKS